jgi:dTDP-4-amino-4,6-dideoxygalactose transaminase
MNFLSAQGIGTGVNYIPVHHFGFFKRFSNRLLSSTELLFDQVLTLPLFADMTDLDVEKVIGSLKEWTRAHS